MAACVEFVDGAMAAGEREEFELRLAAEPALAAAVGALLDTDRMLRTLGRESSQRTASVRRLRPLVWGGSLALAASVLIAIGISSLSGRGGGFRVALAPSFESAADYAASVDALDGVRAPGLDVLRSGPLPNELDIGAREFVERAAAAEAETAQKALENKVRDITAEFFVVPLELARDSEVVVYAFRPKVGDAPGSVEPPLFAEVVKAGRHVLPDERFRLESVTGEIVRYERGFLVPIGAGELTVLVGVRAAGSQRFDTTSFGDAEVARAALEAAGFRVESLRVREPGS